MLLVVLLCLPLRLDPLLQLGVTAKFLASLQRAQGLPYFEVFKESKVLGLVSDGARFRLRRVAAFTLSANATALISGVLLSGSKREEVKEVSQITHVVASKVRTASSFLVGLRSRLQSNNLQRQVWLSQSRLGLN